MSLSLSWTKQAVGGSVGMAEVMTHFFGTALATLTNWEALPAPVNFGASNDQGGVIRRKTDNLHCALMIGKSGGDDIHGHLFEYNKYAPASCTDNPNDGWVAIDTQEELSTKAKCVDGNSMCNVFIAVGSNTGFFLRGETITIDGTRTAPLVEYIHDLGVLVLGDWLANAPTGTFDLSAKSVAGGTSGATATTATSGVNILSSTPHFKFGQQTEFFLEDVTGTPTGTIAGATTGFTASFVSYVGATGKLTVTGGNGRYSMGEVITWSGGSAVIAYVEHMCTRLLCHHDGSMDGVGSHDGYLIGEDADRIILLIPNVSHYVIIGFGKWAESVEGHGLFDCAIMEQTTNTSMYWGWCLGAGGEPLMWNNHMGSLIPKWEPVFLNAIPSTAPTSATRKRYNNGAYVPPVLGGQPKGNFKVLFYNSEDSPVNRYVMTLHGFFLAPARSWKDLATFPDTTTRYGLHLGTKGHVVDFTDGSITP